MNKYYLLLFLLSISVYFVADTVAIKSIIGGVVAGVDQFPYQVSLIINKRNPCGGGLIDDQHVLTAAHCVINAQNDFQIIPHMGILVGSNHLDRISVRAIRIAVENIYVPQNYTYGHYEDDIAVLRLHKFLRLDSVHKYLKKLTLIQKGHGKYAGDTAKIAGFGWNRIVTVNEEEIGRNTQHYLYYANATVLSNHQCHKEYRKKNIIITERLICARVQQSEDLKVNRGVCQGDDGSPLVVDNEIVVGVLIKRSDDCEERHQAALYSRVTYYLDFIRNAMKGIPRDDMRLAYI